MSDQIQAILSRMTANDIGATTLPGAKVYFYQTGTTTPVSIWSNDACTIALANPLIADSVGRIPQVFYNSAFQVKVVIRTSADVLVDTIDPAPRWQSATGAASNVTFVPSTNVPQTNVQTAIDAVAAKAFSFTKQTITTDATAGRLLIVGAFGLGGIAPSSTLALALKSGKYFISPSDPDSPDLQNSICEVDELTSTNLIQTLRTIGTPQTTTYSRRSTNTGVAWSAWVGFTRPASANGVAYKMADGTMMCVSAGLTAPATSAADGSGFRSLTQSWTFPATFIDLPVVSGAPEDIDGWISFGPSSLTAATFRTRRFTALVTAVNVNLMAFGRWY